VSGYKNSGLTEEAYEDRATLEKAVFIINARWGDDGDATFLSGTLADWIRRVDWEEEK
jgi:hypothetical protein